MSASRRIVFLGDRFVDDAEARISLFDRGYLLGDGVFETLRAYEGRVFRLGRHLDRFEEGARELDIPTAIARAALADVVRNAASRVGAPDVYLRLTLSRGEGAPGIGYSGEERSTLSVVASPSKVYPAELYESGIQAGIAEVRKVPAECLPPRVKTASYLPNILARRELARRNLVEGVLLSMGGRVVSGTVSNVFFVRGGRLFTPNEGSGCRPGVTREAVIEVARRVGLGVEEVDAAPSDLLAADELFFTNTMMECLPAASLETRAYDAKRAITRVVHAELRRLVRDDADVA